MADQTQPPKPTVAATAPLPSAAPAARPERVKGHLTRFGMEEAIRRGGSVLYKDRTITNVKDLPSEAELADGDEAAEQAARASIEDRQAALDRERAILDSRRADSKKTPQK